MRKTIVDIQRMKTRAEKIPMVTAYDYTSAQIVDRAEIPIILVGDSLGNVVLGYDTTIPVTMEDMLHHAGAVARGSQQALIVGDMPFLTYTTPDEAMHNAGRFLQEAHVQAVKLEGGRPVAKAVRFLVEHGIPVMGHLGLTPQSVNQFGGNRVQGKRANAARALIEDALELQDAGIFALVLELVPAQLAAEITRRLHVPTIGIGAGPLTDGQVLIWQDLLGLYTDHVPRHTRVYADLASAIKEALETYAREVRGGDFPGPENTAMMDEAELLAALEQLDGHDPDRQQAEEGAEVASG